MHQGIWFSWASVHISKLPHRKNLPVYTSRCPVVAGAELPRFQWWKWGLWGTLKVHEHRESLPLHESGAQLAARLSKANKEARLVEMKICFILDASNSAGEGEADTCSNADLPPDYQGARAFIDRGRELQAETQFQYGFSYLYFNSDATVKD